jgi:mono/diheme cytochrome c family protein
MTTAGVRLALAGATTAALAVLGGCGADGPRTQLQLGEGVYGASCAQCHGGDLGGTERGPSLLDPAYGPTQLADAGFVTAIRNGVEQRLWEFGPMPGNPGLGDEQIDAVIAFVRSRQAGEPAG